MIMIPMIEVMSMLKTSIKPKKAMVSVMMIMATSEKTIKLVVVLVVVYQCCQTKLQVHQVLQNVGHQFVLPVHTLNYSITFSVVS